MTDYTELVKALRNCNGPSFLTCRECQYNNDMLTCPYKMLRDAAAAIEELQAELAGSKDAIRILKHNLEMKKPKRGERTINPYENTWAIENGYI